MLTQVMSLEARHAMILSFYAAAAMVQGLPSVLGPPEGVSEKVSRHGVHGIMKGHHAWAPSMGSSICTVCTPSQGSW
jgi:hypothetical protein